MHIKVETRNVSFIDNVIPKLAMGKTLAASMIISNITADIKIFINPSSNLKI